MNKLHQTLVALSAASLLYTCSSPLFAAEKETVQQDLYAPKINAKLLFATTYGGRGDQWFAGVRIRNGRVQAANKEGLGISVKVNDDDTIKVTKKGNPSTPSKKIRTSLPRRGGTAGPYKFGFNQVDPLLQLPYLRVGGKELWGWTKPQAMKSKVQYAPFEADSRIRAAFMGPNKSAAVVGWTDGGNTCLRAHPYDINRPLKMGVGFHDTGGGAGGASSWLFNITTRGQVIEPGMVFRGMVMTAAWDEWGRIMVGGQRLMRSGQGNKFGYHDGAGILMASSNWENALFKAHFGKTLSQIEAGKKDKGKKKGGGSSIVSIAIDSPSGLAAVCGYLSYQFEGVEAVQEKHGGGRDAFLAVIRLWTPEDYENAKAAEKEAKKK